MKAIPKSNLFYFIFIDVTVLWFFLDYFSKKWAVSSNFKAWEWIPDFFYLIPFQKNEGIAFSIYLPPVIQTLGSTIILCLLAYWGMKHIVQDPRLRLWRTIFLGMAVGGGLGNLVDRISQRYVVDFIVLGPIPVFNIADIGITVGLIGLFATMLVESKTNIKT